jgi:spoIIIJ-associated protein
MSESEQAAAGGASRPERAKAFVAGVLERLGVKASVEAKEGADAIALSVTGVEGGEAFGIEPARRSQVLESIQYLANKAVNRDPNDRKWVTVDVGGFGEAADEELAAMARRLAEKVKKMGKAVALGPMNARERRQVHMALAGEAGLKTQSEGEGLLRRLFIIPGEGPARAPARPRYEDPVRVRTPAAAAEEAVEPDAPDSDDAD